MTCTAHKIHRAAVVEAAGKGSIYPPTPKVTTQLPGARDTEQKAVLGVARAV